MDQHLTPDTIERIRAAIRKDMSAGFVVDQSFEAHQLPSRDTYRQIWREEYEAKLKRDAAAAERERIKAEVRKELEAEAAKAPAPAEAAVDAD